MGLALKTDIKRLREILARLKELGLPKKTTDAIDKWIESLTAPEGRRNERD